MPKFAQLIRGRGRARQSTPKNLVAVLTLKGEEGMTWVDQLGAMAVTQVGQHGSLERSGLGDNERGIICRTR